MFIAILIGIITTLFSYQYGLKIGADKGFQESYKNTFNKYLQTTFDPVATNITIKSKLDFNQLVQKLNISADVESEVAQANFSEALHQTHSEILKKAIELSKLTPTDSLAVLTAYDTFHIKKISYYHNQFKKNLDLEIITDPIFERKAYHAATQFSSTISENICFLLNSVSTLATLNKKMNPTSFASEIILFSFCPTLLNELMPEMAMNFQQAGYFVDRQTLEIGILKNYIRKGITEIATVKDVIKDYSLKKEVDRDFRIPYFKTRYWTSTATIELEADAIIKAGIDIDENFSYEFDRETGILNLILAEPEILSWEIFPSIKKMEDGTFIDVDKEMINQATTDIEMKLRKTIESTEQLAQAKINFEAFFKAIIFPILRFKGIEEVTFKYIKSEEWRKESS